MDLPLEVLGPDELRIVDPITYYNKPGGNKETTLMRVRWDSAPACKGVRLFRYLVFFSSLYETCQNEKTAAFHILWHKNYKPL